MTESAEKNFPAYSHLPKYLLPGETYHNPGINQPGNQKLIIYQSRFIPVGKDCWPD